MKWLNTFYIIVIILYFALDFVKMLPRFLSSRSPVSRMDKAKLLIRRSIHQYKTDMEDTCSLQLSVEDMKHMLQTIGLTEEMFYIDLYKDSYAVFLLNEKKLCYERVQTKYQDSTEITMEHPAPAPEEQLVRKCIHHRPCEGDHSEVEYINRYYIL
jgi:hypothetical protein